MGGGFITRIATAIVAIFLATGWASAPHAETGIPVYRCIRPAAPAEHVAAVFADRSGFSCGTDQRAWGAGDFWVRSHWLPPLPAGARLRSVALWQDAVTVHILYADGTIRRVGFDSTSAWRFVALGGVYEFVLPVAAARPVRLLWHVRGAANLRGVVVDPRIVSPDVSHRLELVAAALFAAFGGLCIALLIFNAALAAALRQRFHPPYCAMMAFLLAYAASTSGLLSQAIGLDNSVRSRLDIVFLAGTAASALIFARRFLAPRMTAGWIRHAIHIAIAMLVVSSAAYALFMPWHPRVLAFGVSLAFLATTTLPLPLLWRGWHGTEEYARAFTLAWALPFSLGWLRTAQSLGILPWNYWVDNSPLAVLTLQALLSGLAIAWRIKLLGKERDAAREQEMLARLLADSDPLTGLMNRRSFLREAIGRPAPHLLTLVDIDHFKQVNDTLGHDGGDQVLRMFADALRAAVPPDALVARIGGEEFAVLASGDAVDLPDAILLCVRTTPMPFDMGVTASLGSERGPIATEAEWKRLYRRADDALYAAKRAGRDRARWAAAA